MCKPTAIPAPKSAIGRRRAQSSRNRQWASRPAFTVLELLVVIGIIVLLAAILVPVVSQVRLKANVAATEGEMQRIMTACINYYHDFNTYPGPLADSVLQTGANPGVNVNLNPVSPYPAGETPPNINQITSSENLVLGLIGFLSAPPGAGGMISYSPPPPLHDVQSLNYLRPASFHYIDYVPEELTTHGQMYSSYRTSSSTPPTDAPGGMPTSEPVNDSTVPEFQDHIASPEPHPIIYMRARVGASEIVSSTKTPAVAAQYDIQQLQPYGFLNVNKLDYLTQPGNTPPPGVTTPADGTPVEWAVYLGSPNVLNQARGKDSFMLISAGPDGLYGTKDDIIVTP